MSSFLNFEKIKIQITEITQIRIFGINKNKVLGINIVSSFVKILALGSREKERVIQIGLRPYGACENKRKTRKGDFMKHRRVKKLKKGTSK